MTTQYTSILKLALPVQGELSGTWGDTVNDNITSMVEEAIAGRSVINSWTANSHTLTTADGTTSESRAAMLEFTDTGAALSGNATVICPTASKIYIAKNAVGSSRTVTLKTSAGTGIAIPDGTTMFLFCDGTNVVEAVTNINSFNVGGTVAIDAIKDEDNMASDSATALATQQSIKAYVDSQVGSFDTLAEVLAQGNTSGGTGLTMSSGDDLTLTGAAYNVVWDSSDNALEFADNAKATFGAGDLQIFHDGSNSYVKDTGTGDLMLQGVNVRIQGATTGNNMFVGVDNGASTLYYQNAAKIATTNTGIDITGTIVGDGLTVESAGTIQLTQNTTAAGDLLGRIEFHDEDSVTGDGGVVRLEAIRGGDVDAPDFQIISTTNGGVLTNRLFLDSATGNIGIGTASPAYNLQIDDASAATLQLKDLSNSGTASIFFADALQNTPGFIQYDNSGNYFRFGTNGSERMRIDSSGRVGIGTTPVRVLDIATTTGGTIIHLTDDATGHTATDGVDIQQEGTLFQIINREAGDIRFGTNNIERMRIDSSGNVGIGTTSPTSVANYNSISVNGTTGSLVDSYYGGTLGGRIQAYSSAYFISAQGASLPLTFGTNNTERMRVSPTGSLLIAHTTANFASVGHGLQVTGNAYHTRDGGNPLTVNRLTSDGTIIDIMKDTVSVGSIGTNGGDIYVGTGDTNILFADGSDKIMPATTSGATRDAAIDLGTTGGRFKDLYLSGTATTGDIYVGAGSATSPSVQMNDTNSGLFAPAGNTIAFSTAGGERVRIDSSGNVGIGTTSPNIYSTSGVSTGVVGIQGGTGALLALNATGTGFSGIDLGGAGIRRGGVYTLNGSHLLFYTNATNSGTSLTERMRIESGGNVGIGTASPTEELTVGSGGSNYIGIGGDGVNASGIRFYRGASTVDGLIEVDANEDMIISMDNTGALGTGQILFKTGATERMRLDSSGNLLVATTNDTPGLGDTDVGASFRADGASFVSRTLSDTSGSTLYVNRNTNDGNLVQFQKDGAIVGSIGTSSSSLYIGKPSGSGLMFQGGNTIPVTGSSAADATYDLGASGVRFKDLYLSGKTYLNTTAGAQLVLQTDATRGFVGTSTSHALVLETAGTEAMRIDASGNVGIGTSSPSNTLHVQKDTGATPTVYINNSGGDAGDGVALKVQASQRGTGIADASIFSVHNNASEIFTVRNDGNVGINTANPSTARLQVKGAGNTVSTNAIFAENSDAAGLFAIRDNGDAFILGNTGIGTSSPQQLLHINGGAADTAFQITNSASGSTATDGFSIIVENPTPDVVLRNRESSNMRFFTANTERMRIDSSGNLLVGDTTPSAKLWVKRTDAGNLFGGRATNATYASTVGFFGADRNTTNNSFYYIDCYNYGSTTYRFRVADSGNATNTNNSYGAISDIKLKENIIDSGSQWDDIKALRVRKYSLKSDNLDAPNKLGVIAQELESAGMAGLVSESVDKDEEGNDLGTVTKTVAYSVLYMKAVKALQEAMDRIETLEAKVAQLEGAN